MIIFEFEEERGRERNITWLGCTDLTGTDKDEEDGIYEQLTAHDAFLDE